MKRRFADARNNKDIIEKEYSNYYINDEDFKGNISILKINKVVKKWFVDIEERCILDDNYIWVEIYPDNKHYCITIMCDKNGKVIEWYFDVCKSSGVEEGVPYEDDLYLDVVIVNDGRINILDEDELIEAYNTRQISKEDFELAYKVKDEILNKYANNIEELKEFTEKYISQFNK